MSAPYTKAEYGVRSDGSIWISFGDPMTGPHAQFDFGRSEELAAFIVGLVNRHHHEQETSSEFERMMK